MRRRIRVTNPTGRPRDASITDADTGEPIGGVERVTIVMDGSRTSLELRMAGRFLAMDVAGEVEWPDPPAEPVVPAVEFVLAGEPLRPGARYVVELARGIPHSGPVRATYLGADLPGGMAWEFAGGSRAEMAAVGRVVEECPDG